MSIITSWASGKRAVRTDVALPTIVGVTMQPTGSAIVSATFDGSQHPPLRVCTGIERLPYDVGKVAARVAALELGRKDLVIIDGAGAGKALWIALGSPRGRRTFKLYEAAGRARQTLVDPFPAMTLDGSFSFAPGLAHQEAMLKALAQYKRDVLDDGIVGNELAIALFLAVGHRPPSAPRVY